MDNEDLPYPASVSPFPKNGLYSFFMNTGEAGKGGKKPYSPETFLYIELYGSYLSPVMTDFLIGQDYFSWRAKDTMMDCLHVHGYAEYSAFARWGMGGRLTVKHNTYCNMHREEAPKMRYRDTDVHRVTASTNHYLPRFYQELKNHMTEQQNQSINNHHLSLMGPEQRIESYMTEYEYSLKYPDFRGFLAMRRARQGWDTHTWRETLKMRNAQYREVISAWAEEMRGQGYRLIEQDHDSVHILHVFDAGGYPQAWIVGGKQDQAGLTASTAVGAKHVVDSVSTELKKQQTQKEFRIENWYDLDTVGRVESKEYYLEYANLDPIYSEYYPYLEKPPLEMMQDFLAAKESVWILYGERGTGKTTFLRHLASLMGTKGVVMISNEEMFNKPAVYSKFQASEHKLLILEDADMATAKRSDGNSAMSTLLGVTDGLIPTDQKVVISTNLSTKDKIDDALYRPGRCFATTKFERIGDPQQIKAVNEKAKLEDNVWNAPTSGLTLSEILNRRINRPSEGGGFLSR